MSDGERRPYGPLTVASYAVVVLLAVELAVWGAFLVPVRGLGVPLPVAPLVAVAGNLGLAVAGARLLRSRAGCVPPVLLWLGIALTAGTRTHGDLVVPGTPMGYVFLFGGFAAALVGLVVGPTPAGRGRR